MTEKSYDFKLFDTTDLEKAEDSISRIIAGKLSQGAHPNGPTLGTLTERRNEIRKAIAAKEAVASAQTSNGATSRDMRGSDYWNGYRDGREDDIRERKEFMSNLLSIRLKGDLA